MKEIAAIKIGIKIKMMMRRFVRTSLEKVVVVIMMKKIENIVVKRKRRVVITTKMRKKKDVIVNIVKMKMRIGKKRKNIESIVITRKKSRNERKGIVSVKRGKKIHLIMKMKKKRNIDETMIVMMSQKVRKDTIRAIKKKSIAVMRKSKDEVK